MLVILPIGNLAMRIDGALRVTDYVFSVKEIADAAVHYINGDVDCAMGYLFRETNTLDESFSSLPYTTPSDQALMHFICQLGREIDIHLFNLYHTVCVPRFVNAGDHYITLTVEL